MDDITGVILAGGQSSRMGQPKAFLKLGKEYFIQRIYNTLSSAFPRVIVSSDDILSFAPIGVTFQDVFKGRGPLAGIHSALLNSSAGCFVASSDLPLLSEALIRFILAGDGTHDVIVGRTNSGIQPLCGLYKQSSVPKLEECLQSGSYSVLRFLSNVNTKYLDIPSELEPQLANINTPSDYQRMLQSFTTKESSLYFDQEKKPR